MATATADQMLITKTAAASRFSADIRAIRIVWKRELIRFKNDRTRLISSLIQPVLYLFVLGTGLVTHVEIAILNNVLTCLGTLAVLAALVREHSCPAYRVIAVLCIGAAIDYTAATIGGLAAMAILGFVISTSMYLPQAFRVAKGDVSGVSFTTWLLALITASLWCVFGVQIHELVYAAPGVIMVPATAYIAWRCRPQRFFIARLQAVRVSSQ